MIPFSFAVPPGWDEVAVGDGIAVLASATDGFRPNVVVAARTMARGEAVEGVVAAEAAALPLHFDDVVLLDRSPVPGCRRATWRLLAAYRDGDLVLTMDQAYVTITPRRLVVLTATAPSALYDSLVPVFDAITDSLEVPHV